MFSNLRLFYVFSFLIVISATLFLGTYIRIEAIEGIARLLQNNNKIINEFFQNQIWLDYEESISEIDEFNFSDQFKTDNIKQLRALAEEFSKKFPAMKISVLLPSQIKLYENNNIEIVNETSEFFRSYLSHNDQKIAFRNAVGGRNDMHILHSGAYFSLDNEYKEHPVLRLYFPLYDSAGEVNGVLEILQDFSVEWTQTYNFQLYVTLAIIIVFLLLYISLIYNSYKAARIIDSQFVENQKLADAKSRAEVESQEKSKFLANVSHELRTPLNAIIGFSEMIKTEVAGPLTNDVYRDYINDIHNSGTHLLSLINDILDYSKAMAEKLTIDNVEIDINKIAQTSIRLIQPRAEEAKVKLYKDITDEKIFMKGDPKRLKQVLLNLLSNSVKFTPENKSVTLMASEDSKAGRVIIKVKDTGIGISAKNIAKALSSFGQVESDLSRRYEGTGLGLPLTKKLVEMMGGEFHIHSEEGKGTEVELSFPIYEKNNDETIPQNTKEETKQSVVESKPINNQPVFSGSTGRMAAFEESGQKEDVASTAKEVEALYDPNKVKHEAIKTPPPPMEDNTQTPPSPKDNNNDQVQSANPDERKIGNQQNNNIAKPEQNVPTKEISGEGPPPDIAIEKNITQAKTDQQSDIAQSGKPAQAEQQRASENEIAAINKKPEQVQQQQSPVNGASENSKLSEVDKNNLHAPGTPKSEKELKSGDQMPPEDFVKELEIFKKNID